MRHLDTTARIAIATLYLRYRDARRLAAIYRIEHGITSRAAIVANDSEIAVWNALQAVLTNVHADRSTMPTKEFMRLVGLRGKKLAQRLAA